MKTLGLKISAFYIFLTPFLLPALVNAQVYYGGRGGIKDLILSIGGLVSLLIPITAACALLFFFWGLANFVLHADNDDKRQEGRKLMLWGIVALFVIVSIWGITRFIGDDLGIPDVRNLPVQSF